MIVLGNVEAGPGIAASVAALRAGVKTVPALVTGVALVEAAETVRSVGYGGWPNLLGAIECDGAVMDGDQRRIGAVAAVPGVLHVARLAAEVMECLPHVMLAGAGARRFADELGWAQDDMLHPDSKRVWWQKLAGLLSPAQQAAFPDVPLIPLVAAITDPEKVRDTTVFLGQDASGSLGVATSTSGWAVEISRTRGRRPDPRRGILCRQPVWGCRLHAYRRDDDARDDRAPGGRGFAVGDDIGGCRAGSGQGFGKPAGRVSGRGGHPCHRHEGRTLRGDGRGRGTGGILGLDRSDGGAGTRGIPAFFSMMRESPIRRNRQMPRANP